MEWIETTGVSVDEAKEKALDRLGVPEDDLDYQIYVLSQKRLTPWCS